MASAFSHAIVAGALGTALWRPGMPARFLVVGAFFSVLPDLDVVGFNFGIQYADLLGHRGLTHSLVFAAGMAILGVFLCAGESAAKPGRWMTWCYLFLATA